MFTGLPLRTYLEKMAEPAFPSPKGGSAAALAGALAGALLSMSAQVTAKKSPQLPLSKVWTQAENISKELSHLADRDVQAYLQVIEAHRLLRQQGTDARKGKEAIEEALQKATETLLESGNCSRLLELEEMRPLSAVKLLRLKRPVLALASSKPPEPRPLQPHPEGEFR